MARKDNAARPLHWRETYHSNGNVASAAATGAHHEYEIVEPINESRHQSRLSIDGDLVTTDHPDELRALADTHNRRAVKIGTPFRSVLAPVQHAFIEAAGTTEAKVGGLPLPQFRYLHDDLAMIDYVSDPEIPEWKDYPVQLTARGVDYLAWRTEQDRTKPPATWQAERAKLEAALAQTKASFDQVEPVLREATATLGRVKLERDALVQKLDAAETQTESLRREIERLSAQSEPTPEMDDLVRRINHLRAELAGADEKIIELTLELRESNRERDEAKRFLELTREELQKAREAFKGQNPEIFEELQQAKDALEAEQAFSARERARSEEYRDANSRLKRAMKKAGLELPKMPKPVAFQVKIPSATGGRGGVTERLLAKYPLATMEIGASFDIAPEDLNMVRGSGYRLARKLGRDIITRCNPTTGNYVCMRTG